MSACRVAVGPVTVTTIASSSGAPSEAGGDGERRGTGDEIPNHRRVGIRRHDDAPLESLLDTALGRHAGGGHKVGGRWHRYDDGVARRRVDDGVDAQRARQLLDPELVLLADIHSRGGVHLGQDRQVGRVDRGSRRRRLAGGQQQQHAGPQQCHGPTRQSVGARGAPPWTVLLPRGRAAGPGRDPRLHRLGCITGRSRSAIRASTRCTTAPRSGQPRPDR